MANTAEEAKVNNQIIENLFNKCEASIKAFDNLIEKAKNLTKKKIVKEDHRNTKVTNKMALILYYSIGIFRGITFPDLQHFYRRILLYRL